MTTSCRSNESDLHGNYTDHSFNRIIRPVITCMYCGFAPWGALEKCPRHLVILATLGMGAVTNIYISTSDGWRALRHWACVRRHPAGGGPQPFGPVLLCRVVMTTLTPEQFTSIFLSDGRRH
ncbi:somatostatin receptor type 2-like protein [Lates japonicus]|uniref:Somatostatin receptor type 2-like protein n=1 Tax=Lates japonicus TaxID=270547 RepID=A0AAD3QX83_LATJO|nr:somatostatin receptor type 2-like protein [Lates japonicus]